MFIGNQKAIKLLEKSIKNGKVSQSYLFSGPESVGKFTLAKIFAGSLIKDIDLNLENEAKNLPDLIILEPEIEEKRGIIKEKEIKIEQIRDAQKNLATFPYGGKYKVLIINNAHKMNVSSQNALLKILEEPNSTSIIILVTHNDSKILSTIKSRCQKINFSLAETGEIKKISSKKGGADELVLFSMGRPGLVFKMMEDEEEIERKREDFKKLKNFPSLGINEKLKLAEEISSNTVKAISTMEFWIWLIRLNALKNSKNGNFPGFKVIKKIEEGLDAIKNTNANARLVLENLFLDI